MSDLAATLARLNAITKGPKPYIVTIRYDDNTERSIPCYSEQSAKMCAERESYNIGKPLISDNGATIVKLSVNISYECEA